jgi:hypothetical protein
MRNKVLGGSEWIPTRIDSGAGTWVRRLLLETVTGEVFLSV